MVFLTPRGGFIRPPTFESPTGEAVVAAPQGASCCVRMDIRFHQAAEDPLFSFSLVDDLGHAVFAGYSHFQYGPSGAFHPGEHVTVRMRFENWLAPGRYRLTTSANRNGPGADTFDTREHIASLIVHATHTGGGSVDLPSTFEIERSE